MKTRKETENEARRWLDHVVREGSYNAGVLIAVTNMYFDGARDAQQEIKDALGITECDCPCNQ